VEVSEATQVGEARRTAARIAETMAFDIHAAGQVAIVASELARNLATYGSRGRLFIQPMWPVSGPCIELLAVDSGPGMIDVDQCLEDGYSTGGTPGTGLGAVRRMSSEFDVYSGRDRGTAVVARVRGSSAPPAARPSFEWGAVSSCAPGEQVCGDAWRVREQDGRLSVVVADGLGHGPQAAEAADRVGDAFEMQPFETPSDLLSRAHVALQGGRGAAVAVGSISSAPRLSYIGIGNISGTLFVNARSKGLFSHNGTIGVQMRAAKQLDYEWSDESVLVMHSDGLTSRWTLDGYPGLLFRHPALIAGVLHRDFVRGRDDATVVVMRNTPHQREPLA